MEIMETMDIKIGYDNELGYFISRRSPVTDERAFDPDLLEKVSEIVGVEKALPLLTTGNYSLYLHNDGIWRVRCDSKNNSTTGWYKNVDDFAEILINALAEIAKQNNSLFHIYVAKEGSFAMSDEMEKEVVDKVVAKRLEYDKKV